MLKIESQKGENMLELQNICFCVDGKKILDDINLKFDYGKIYAITGHNGSGNSTMVKIIMGILKQTQGNIIFDGKNINDLNITARAKAGIGFTFQQPVKFKGLTVRDLLETAAHDELNFKCGCEYLSRVGLCAKDYYDRELSSSLSGGELKRIEIATAMARGTELTVFDEPEAGIDLWSFNNLITVFEKMREKTNGSILIISHQERILNIADRIIVITNGQICEDGKKEDILPSLLNTSVACSVLTEKF